MFLNKRYFLSLCLALCSALLCPPKAASASKPAKTFALALPGYRYSFPRDHASHDRFATEWWYYTGRLRADSGRVFGYQITFFRSALTPSTQRSSQWATRNVILGHLALTDLGTGKFYFAETVSRAAVGLAGASGPPAHIWLHDWNLRFIGDGTVQRFNAKGRSEADATKDQLFGLQLQTESQKNPVINGQNGISQKSVGVGQASHYYSLTRLHTTGTVRVGNERFTVKGESWFDHEFGSSQLGKNQIGWDWFALILEDGRELMLYQLRTTGNGIDPFSSGTIVLKDGSFRHLPREAFRITPTGSWKSPQGVTYPAGWSISVPSVKLQLTVMPELANQEMRTRVAGVNYWEGLCRVSGGAKGHGYVELTGYSGTLTGKF